MGVIGTEDGANRDKSSSERGSAGATPFLETITKLVMDQVPTKSIPNDQSTLMVQNQEKKRKDIAANSTQPAPQNPPKRACRAPPSRKFAHPCSCGQSNHHKLHPTSLNVTANLPAAAFTSPLHLYDPMSKKCLPTSRTRDMLLKECRTNVASPYSLPQQLYHGAPCFYDDLVCDARRNRCTCKPSFHLFYESNHSAFGCVPLDIQSNFSPDGRTTCRSNQVYNVISKECQKIFDISELPPTQMTGVSATQFSLVTIVLIWILLLVLIVTAKLRKLRTSNVYGSSFSERRQNRGSSYRANAQSGASAWLHSFLAAVNGHHQPNHARVPGNRTSNGVDDNGNFNDTDFFLANGRRLNELFSDAAFVGSQHSLNNPPPKFEEIYPTCQSDGQQQQQQQQQPGSPHSPSTQDLPTYDEAMRFQNTSPQNLNQKG